MVEGTQAAGGGPLDPRTGAPARRLPGRDPAGAATVRHRRGLHAARARGAAVPGCGGGGACGQRAARCHDIDTGVRPEWVDYNGHMTDFRYVQLSSAMPWMRCIGASASMRPIAQAGQMFYTVESHIRHLAEAQASASRCTSTTQVLAVDDKRLHVFHRCIAAATTSLIATGEQMHLHVDTAAAKAAAMDRGAARAARGDPARARRAAATGRRRAPDRAAAAKHWADDAQDRRSCPAARGDRAGGVPGRRRLMASSRPPWRASPARPATRPAWWRITTTRSRTSSSRRCA